MNLDSTEFDTATENIYALTCSMPRENDKSAEHAWNLVSGE